MRDEEEMLTKSFSTEMLTKSEKLFLEELKVKKNQIIV
jgi:hypothetical protein